MSRLIDADCINFYKATVARGTHSFDNVEIVEKFQIDRMPTIDPESLRPRWIPVTERLPEADRTFTHDKSVLVYVPENKKMLHHGIYEGKLVTDEIDGERVTDWLLWGWPYIDRERPFVTHWMPLPEPPEVSE